MVSRNFPSPSLLIHSAAFDVSVIDIGFPEEYFEVVEGDLSARFDTISPGAVVKHTYLLKPRVSGPYSKCLPAIYTLCACILDFYRTSFTSF